MPEANDGEAADKVAQGDWQNFPTSSRHQDISILRGGIAALL